MKNAKYSSKKQLNLTEICCTCKGFNRNTTFDSKHLLLK